MGPPLRVALCHQAPVYLNAKATTQKCLRLIQEAARNGANLVVFPEVWLPGYSFWSCMVSPGDAHGFFQVMVENSVYADGEEVAAIRNEARENSIFVCLGFSEKTRHSSANLYNSNLMISSSGEVVVHHRKLVPTFYEKLVWSPGDGNGLRVVDVPIPSSSGASGAVAKVGVLLCGENTNPLARYSMMAQGEQIHITTWPAKAPMHNIRADSQPRMYDNVAVNRIRAGAHSFEGKCFSIINTSYCDDNTLQTLLDVAPEPVRDVIRTTMDGSMQAESRFLNPSGGALMGFVVNPESGEKEERESLQHEEGILYADLDVAATVEGKQFQDVVGGYQRFDVFQLKVDRSRQTPITFTNNFSGDEAGN
ncbi:Nitrilase/cyanide hydratase and apolipoprotein N-acyltransferase [Niveomyces insectorum RCEF 264]|uniref:Nitrilase/cyanide hydratase and apolipoprotein N-acyltransferase n=1 Tax=Niveomyces insectorum RCEF 264 TaxID=1081102 RepID=A0A167RXQ0_9HYPO|nr:Nitrilase/cyanide hydratase and apolipoprotein N-acyltransferase [Niveomyces insectorum RCEF 264]